MAVRKIPDGLLRLILFAAFGLFFGAIFFGESARSEERDWIKNDQIFSCPIGMYPYDNNGLYGCRKDPSPRECALAAIGRYDLYAEMLGVSIDLTRKREPFLSERRKFIEDACD
jgi:hypothetical protein